MEQQRNPQTRVDFLDFELEIGQGTGGMYPVAVVRSPAGESREVMRFPFDNLTLENRLLMLENTLLSSGGGRRHVLLPEDQKVQDFGIALFNALFIGKVGNLYAISQHEATLRNKGLRLKLRILSPEMAVLPWEFLYDSSRAEYICLSRNTPLVRYIESPQPPQPLLVTPPLRILGMIATPANLPPLDAQREQQRIEKAVDALQQRGLVELTWLPGQTWRDVQQAMRNGPWHVFHFIGHGSFDVNAEEGLIAFTNEAGQADLLRASQLGRLLVDHRSLRLVVLNACEGAQGDRLDIFSSTAAILVRYGLPAVLAMQFAIKDTTAIVLSRAFYEALADGMPIDAAVSEARKAVSLDGKDTLEWGIPVLYMRAPDGTLFTINQSSSRQQPQTTKSATDGNAIRPGNGAVEPGRTSVIPPRFNLRAVPFSLGKNNLFRAITLIALAILIVGSIGLIYPRVINRINVQATATTGANAHLTATAASASAQLTASAAASEYAQGIAENGIMFGFDAAHSRFNPYEKILNPINVSGLVKDWKMNVSYINNKKIFSSPTVAYGLVLIGSIDGYLYAFSASNGNSGWVVTTQGPLHSPIYSSPAVANGVVYVGSADGKLYAFTAKGPAVGGTGCACPPLWTASTGGSISSSPVVFKDVVYVGSHDGKLYAFNASTGKTLWTASTGNVIDSSRAVDVIDSSPAVDKNNGVVYVGSHDGKLYAFNASTGKTLWTASIGDVISSPAVASGVVYVGSYDGKLYAFNAKGCGQDLSCSPLWTANAGTQTQDLIFSSPAVANGVVYIGSEDHKLYAFNATTGKTLWTALTGDAIDSSPTVANGVVYIGSVDGNLYAFNANGCGQAFCSPLWKAPTGNQVNSSPAVANGVVYVGSFDGNLYAYHLFGV